MQLVDLKQDTFFSFNYNPNEVYRLTSVVTDKCSGAVDHCLIVRTFFRMDGTEKWYPVSQSREERANPYANVKQRKYELKID